MATRWEHDAGDTVGPGRPETTRDRPRARAGLAQPAPSADRPNAPPQVPGGKRAVVTACLGPHAREAPAGLQALVASQHASTMNQLLAYSGVALAIMAVVSAGLGWVVAGRALRPLRVITAAAREISVTSLDRRLGLAGPDDEITELGGTFDDLLSRLEAAFAAQRQFAANASHEPATRGWPSG